LNAPGELPEGPVTTRSEPVSLPCRAQRLREVACRIEEFLVRQISRLQDEVTKTVASVGSDRETAALQAEFELLREQLEEERQREMEQMQEDAQRLAESWQHLEAEQRELLMKQATMRTVPTPAAVEPEGLVESGSLHPLRLSPGGGVATVGAEIRAIAGGATIQKAQLQFQQLRREMQRHSQQRKKY